MGSIAEGRIHELEDRTIEITQSEQQRGNKLKLKKKKTNRILGSCSIVRKVYYACYLSPRKRRERGHAWEKTPSSNGCKLPKFGKRCKLKESKRQADSNQDKLKETHTKTQKHLKILTRKIILKAARETTCL